MDAYVTAFWLPKDGNSDTEYEDVFFPRKAGRYQIKSRLRFAIADGATEASFSKLWAKLLVKGFVRKRLSVPLSLEQLKPMQDQWERIVRAKPLPWYAEQKLSSGAFASLLGLELEKNCSESRTERVWQATAVGDSCLVQVRGDEIIKAFPVTESSSFTNRPNLVASLSVLNGSDTYMVQSEAGTWGFDDTFFLMTDALACWFFKERESGKQPWNLLRDLGTQGQVSFREFVAKLRSSRAMQNDDVTLMRIDIVG